MSGEQRDNNLGIDPQLRVDNPLEYARQLEQKRRKLLQEFEELKKKDAEERENRGQ